MLPEWRRARRTGADSVFLSTRLMPLRTSSKSATVESSSTGVPNLLVIKDLVLDPRRMSSEQPLYASHAPEGACPEEARRPPRHPSLE